MNIGHWNIDFPTVVCHFDIKLLVLNLNMKQSGDFKIGRRETKRISAHADEGPRSRVCACETLRSAPPST